MVWSSCLVFQIAEADGKNPMSQNIKLFCMLLFFCKEYLFSYIHNPSMVLMRRTGQQSLVCWETIHLWSIAPLLKKPPGEQETPQNKFRNQSRALKNMGSTTAPTLCAHLPIAALFPCGEGRVVYRETTPGSWSVWKIAWQNRFQFSYFGWTSF